MATIVRFSKIGGPEVLELIDETSAEPKAGEIRIRVKALGLNRAEAMFRSGAYLEDPKLPARLGYEAAGTIDAIGAGVEGFALGDAVSVVPSFSQNDFGVYGEVATVPATAVVKHPASLSFEAAAATWMQYATAYGALVEIAHVIAGDAVIITAASSSVGLAAIQIANRLGATSIALTRTSAKVAALRAAGAHHVVVTEDADPAAAIRAIVPRGARVAFDPVGGPAIEMLARAVAPHAIIFQYGALSTEPTPLPLFTLLEKSLTIRGYVLFEITQNPEALERTKRFVIDGLADGSLTPVIAKTFPLEQIVEAHRYLESNAQVGKVIVTVGS